MAASINSCNLRTPTSSLYLGTQHETAKVSPPYQNQRERKERERAETTSKEQMERVIRQRGFAANREPRHASEPTIQEADGKDKLKDAEDEENGQWGRGKDEDGTWMCLRSVGGVGHAVELGVGILDEDLLDNPPDGRTVGNMVVQASRHARVQDGERISIAREDKRTRISMVRKVIQILAIVIHDDLPGLLSEVGAGIGIHSRVPAQRKLGRVAVLGNDIEGLAVLVLRIGIDDGTTRKSTTDGELEIGWDRPALTNGSERPEEILELTSGILITEVNDVALKVPELLVIDCERGDVASVVAVVDPDGDVGSPVDDTEPATVGVFPVGVDVVE